MVSWFSVVACQRYVCPNVISMTMNVIIQECIIENCFIEPYVNKLFAIVMAGEVAIKKCFKLLRHLLIQYIVIKKLRTSI